MDTTAEEVVPLMEPRVQTSSRSVPKTVLLAELLLSAAGFVSSLVVAIVCTTSSSNWYSFGAHTDSGWTYYLIAGCFCAMLGVILPVICRQHQAQNALKIALIFGAVLLALFITETLALFLPTDAAWGPLAVPFGETQTKLVWYTGRKTLSDITVNAPVY